jgi:hypothetical protein
VQVLICLKTMKTEGISSRKRFKIYNICKHQKMKQLINNLKGDKGIWSFVALYVLFMPVLVRVVI